MNTLSSTNISALNSISNSNYAHKKISSSLERLASGTRVVSYADGITSSLSQTSSSSHINAISSDIRSTNATLAMLLVADKAIDEQLKILNVVRVKALNAVSDTISQRDRIELQNEIKALLEDLDDIAERSTFGGNKLLTGEMRNQKLTLGSKGNEQYVYDIAPTTSRNIGKVRYETTKGGSRNISALSLRFADIGSSGEDVRLDPFNLSSSPGTTLRDLAQHVNANSNKLGGVRAIYKQGEPPSRKEVRDYKLDEEDINQNTTSFWKKTDFEEVDYDDGSSDVESKGEVKTSLPKKLEKERDMHSTSGEVEREKWTETLAPYIKRENFTFKQKEFPTVPSLKPSSPISSSDGSNNPIATYVLPSSDVPYFPKFRASSNNVSVRSNPGVQVTLTGGILGGSGDYSRANQIFHINDGGVNFDPRGWAVEGGFTDINGVITLKFGHKYSNGRFNLVPRSDSTTYAAKQSSINSTVIFKLNGAETHRGRTTDYTTIHAVPISPTIPANVFFDEVVLDAGHQYLQWREVQVFGDPVPALRATISNPIFEEAVANDGTIGNKRRVIDLKDRYTRLTGSPDFNIIPHNLPAGLSVSFKLRADNKTVDIELKGTAVPNELGDSRHDVRFSFGGTFSAGITPLPIENISVRFLSSPAELIIDKTEINENTANDGSLSDDSLVLTVDGDTLGANWKTSMSIANLPVGVHWNAVAVPGTDNKIRIFFEGNAYDHVTDIDNVTFEFSRDFATRGLIDGTKLNTTAGVDVTNSIKINFRDNPTPVATIIGTNIFSEVDSNDGSIRNTIQVDLGDIVRSPSPYFFSRDVLIPEDSTALNFWFSTFHDNLSNAQGLVATDTGLTIVAVDPNNTLETVTPLKAGKDKSGLYNFTGLNGRRFQIELVAKGGNRYDAHLIDTEGGLDDNAGRTIKFGLLRRTTVTGSIVPPTPESETLRERITNFPSIHNPFISIDAQNLPLGLKTSYKLEADVQTITIELSGPADPHTNAQDVDLIFSFFGTFNGGVAPANTLLTKVDFKDVPITATIQGAFSELRNTGTIENRVDITFDEDLIRAPGLIARDYAVSGVQLFDHVKINDTVIPFTPLNLGNTVNITYKGEDISITRHAADSIRVVSSTNVKANSIQFIHRTGVPFAGTDYDIRNPDLEIKVTSPNLVALTTGLKISSTVIDSRTIRVELSGGAMPHSDDINNLAFEFEGTFRTGETPTPILDAEIDFNVAQLEITHRAFSEVVTNNGSLHTMNIHLTLGIFDGFFGATVADGLMSLVGLNPHENTSGDLLRASFTLTDTSNILVKIEGMARSHQERDSLTLTFDFHNRLIKDNVMDINASMGLVLNLGTGVLDDVRDEISLEFHDNVVPKPSIESFFESERNDGSISNRIVILDLDDSFIGLDSLNDRRDGLFIAASNVPLGLSFTYAYIDHQHVRVTLLGTAVNGDNVYDVDNLEFSFTGIFSSGHTPILDYGIIDFLDPLLTIDGDTISESILNDGSTETKFNINVSYGVFKGFIGGRLSNGLINLGGLPSNISDTYTLLDRSTIEVMFTGNALSHRRENNKYILSFDFMDRTIVLDNSANLNDNELWFDEINELNVKNHIKILFMNPTPITTIDVPFSESFANIGQIENKATISLGDDSITKDVNDITISNLPNGFDPIHIVWLNNSQIEVELLGHAISHNVINSINDLQFSFRGEYSGGMTPATLHGSIEFIDNVYITINDSVFVENNINDGSMRNFLTLNFSDAVLSRDAHHLIKLNNVPSNFEVVYRRLDNSNIGVVLTKNAISHNDVDDVDGVDRPFLSFDFDNAMIVDNRINLNDGGVHFNGIDVRERIQIDFVEAKITTANKIFYENEFENDGRVRNTIILESVDAFSAGLGTDDIHLIGLPNSLKASYALDGSHRIIVTLSSSAVNHSVINNISNMYFTFDDNVLANNIKVADISNVSIEYFDTLLSVNDDTFKEDRFNQGSIANKITINISGNTIKDTVFNTGIQDLIIALNVPANLSAIYNILDRSNIEVSLINEANNHKVADNKNNIIFFFHPIVFQTPTRASETPSTAVSISNIYIEFIDAAVMEIDPVEAFTEKLLNDGSIGNPITLRVSGDVISNIEDNDLGNYINTINIPNNLSAVFRRISNTKVEVSLVGNALSHIEEDSLSNIEFTFDKNFLVNEIKTNNLTGAINFFDTPILKANDIFIEDEENDGSIRSPITITIIKGDQFSLGIDSARLDDLISAANLPLHLVAKYSLISETQLEISLANRAADNANINDVNDLDFTFEAELFKGGVIPVTVESAIDFFDAPIVTIAPIFKEQANNDGGIENVATATLKNDTWNIRERFTFAARGFIVNDLAVERILVDGVDILSGKESLSIDQIVQQMGYNANGVGVTTNGGKTATIYADNVNGELIFYSNEIEEGDSINVSFKLDGYDFNNKDFLVDNPNVDHILQNSGAINPENIHTKIATRALPLGLTASYTYIDSTHIRIKLEGSVVEANQLDIDSYFSFTPDIFRHNIKSNEASNHIDFIDRATISLSSNTFSEQDTGITTTNTGNIRNTINLYISGDSIDETLAINNNYLLLDNVPAGLSVSFATGGDNTDGIIVLSLSGTAVSHRDEDSLSNLKLSINPDAFSSKLTALDRQGNTTNDIDNISIDYLDEAIITADGLSFFESSLNDGSIHNTITFTISGGALLKQEEKSFNFAYRIPLAGIKKQGFVTIAGQKFDSFDFSDNLGGISSKLAKTINAGSAGTLVDTGIIYAKAFGESLLILSDTNKDMVVNIKGKDFTVSNDTTIASSDKSIQINSTSVDINDFIDFDIGDFSGLSPHFTAIDAHKIEMRLDGRAESHSVVDNDFNLRIRFLNGIFDKAPFAITGGRQAVNTVFLDNPSMSFTGGFKELSSNLGKIDGTTKLSIKIANDRVDNSLTDITIASLVSLGNLPAGLSPTYFINPARDEISITLTGNALSHKVEDSIRNLYIDLNKDIFISKNNYDNLVNIDVDFIDEVRLVATPKVFQEDDQNEGLIDNYITLTVEHDVISGTPTPAELNDMISFITVPAGLKAEYSYVDSTHIEVRLSGTRAGGTKGAGLHANTDDVDNLKFTFEPRLLVNSFIIKDIEDIAIDFGESVNISAMTNDFSEEFYSNNGFIDTVITLAVKNGELDFTTRRFEYASKLDVGLFSDIAEHGVLTIDGVVLSDSSNNSKALGDKYELNTDIRDFSDTANRNLAYHIASVINNGYKGTTLQNGDKLFANVESNLAKTVYSVILLKDTSQSILIQTKNIEDSFANDNSINPTSKSVKIPLSDAKLNSLAAYINSPFGLTPHFKALSTKLIEVELIGNANPHRPIDSRTTAGRQLEFTFSPDAFGNDALYVEPASNVNVHFVDNLIFNTLSFGENIILDDGSMSNSLILNFGGGGSLRNTITAANLITLISAFNLPSGLTATYSLVAGNPNQLEISLGGKADSHRAINSVDDVYFTFDRTLFDATKPITTRANAEVEFINKAILEFDETDIVELGSNQGIIPDTTINVHISDGIIDSKNVRNDGTWNDVKLNELIIMETINFITASWHIINASNLQVEIRGLANAHVPADDNQAIEFDFSDLDILEGRVAANDIMDGINLKFIDAMQLSLRNDIGFSEALLNDGSISGPIVITMDNGRIDNDIRVGSFITNDSDGNPYIIVDNLPTGLSPVYRVIGVSAVAVTLVGQASKSEINDSTKLDFTFNNKLFFNEVVADPLKDVRLDFINKATLTLEDNVVEDGLSLSLFRESTSNKGSFHTGDALNKITISITGDELSYAGTNTLMNAKLNAGIAVSNLAGLEGLQASFRYINSRRVEISLSGLTHSHLSPNFDIGNEYINAGRNGLEFSFSSSLFKDERNIVINPSYVDVDFINKADIELVDNPLVADDDTFNEEPTSNTGSIEHPITLHITNTTSNMAFFVPDIALLTASISAVNLPTGLVPVYTFEGDNRTIKVTLTGEAVNSDSSYNVDNLVFKFDKKAFTDSIGVSSPDLKVTFIDNTNLNAVGLFNESVDNDGSMANRVSIKVDNADGAIFKPGTISINNNISITNLPVGLVPSFKYLNPKEIELELSGATEFHGDINDRNISVRFLNSALLESGNKPKTVSIFIDFEDAPKMEILNDETFKENLINDGSISNKITFRISNGKINDNVEINSLINTLNIAPNLKASFSRINNNNSMIIVELSGQALLHAKTNSMDDLEFQFDGGLFKRGIKPINLKAGIDYISGDRARLEGKFREDGLNKGAMDPDYKITVTLANDTFKGNVVNNVFVPEGFTPTDILRLENIPSGIGHTAEVISDKQIVVSINGTANAHAPSDKISNISINWLLKEAFTSGISPDEVKGIELEFLDYSYASISGKFFENSSNDGSITGKATIALSNNNTFNNVSDVSSMIDITNLPNGLSPVYTYINGGRAMIVEIIGSATTHNSELPINLSFKFNNADLFTQKLVANDVSTQIAFINKSTVSLSDKWVERNENDGRFDTTVLINILGDQFVGDVGVSVNNLPSGLRASTSKLSDSAIRISLAGQASHRDAVDSKTDLSIEFTNDNDFRSGSKPDIITAVSITYVDASKIIPTGELIESLEDNGEIDGKITLTTEGTDTFDSGAINLDQLLSISYSNGELEGLTPKYKLIGDKTIELSFEGTAVNHLPKVGDIDFSLSFKKDLMANKIAPIPIDLKLKFIKLGILSISSGLKEDKINTGLLENGTVISIADSTFSNVADINNAISVKNLPLGVVANFSFVNNTSIEVNFIGSAASHDIVDSKNDIEFSFDKSLIKNEIGIGLKDATLDFYDAPKMAYDKVFLESKSDDGSMTSAVFFTLLDDNIRNGYVVSDYISASIVINGVETSGLPDGLSLRTQSLSKNKFALFLDGNATSHTFKDNIDNLKLTFQGDFLENRIAPATIENFKISFLDTPNISFAPNGFNELLTDTGAIDNKVTISVDGDEFDSNVDPNSFVNITSLPPGLSLALEVDTQDSTKLILALTGEAYKHTEDDTSAIRLSMLGGLFKKKVPPPAFNIPVKFITANRFVINDRFIESPSNDGSVEKRVLLNLEGSTLKNVNPNGFITVNNVPAGLNARFNFIDDTTIEMVLVNAARAHGSQNSTTNDSVLPMSLSFKSGLFDNDVPAKDIDILHITFIDIPRIQLSGGFVEDYTNDGSIDTSITFTVKNDLYDQSLDPNNFIVASELPEGLSLKYKLLSANKIVAFIEGQAKEHTSGENFQINFEFNNELFRNKLAPEPLNNVDVRFDSVRAGLLTVDGEFIEDIQNNGAIPTSIIVNIADDEIADKYKFPYSMIVENLRDLIGVAGNGEDGDETSVFVINGVAFPKVPILTNEIEIEDEAIINYLVEQINNKGAGTQGFYAELTRDVNGDPFLNILKHQEDRVVTLNGSTGIQVILENHYNFGEPGYIRELTALGLDPTDPTLAIDRTKTARETDVAGLIDRLVFDSNLPAGLSSKFTLLDNKRLLVELSGKAFEHSARDSIDNYTIRFSKEALKKGLAPRPLEVPIKFQNPQIEYKGEFVETGANNGSIGGALTLFLTGDEFKDNINPRVLNGLFRITNTPDGLIPNFIIEANNVVRFELIGQARDHDFRDSIKDLEISFNSKLFKNDIPADDIKNVKVNFIDVRAVDGEGGGSGVNGDYITFISPRGNNLIISAGGADFGIDGNEYQKTLEMRHILYNRLNEDDLYAIGDEPLPRLTQLKGGYGEGVTSRTTSMVFLDAVDAAIDNLNQTRNEIQSMYQRIQKAGEFLEVEKINIQSANSRLVDINFAEESAKFNRANILSQAANFALTQSNALQKSKISALLDGIK